VVRNRAGNLAPKVTLLTHDSVTGLAGIGRFQSRADHLKKVASKQQKNGKPLMRRHPVPLPRS